MPLLRITNGIEKIADAKLVERAYGIHQLMSGNPAFPTPTPTMVDLAVAMDAFKTAVQKASAGDRLLIAEKHQKRDVLVAVLHSLGYYVLYAANGDRVKAQSSGFTIAREPTPVTIHKPQDLKVSNTSQQGQLAVSVKKVKGSVAYIHQYTTDSLLKDESWQSITNSVSKYVLNGLTPGTTYYVRVAAVGRKEQIMFSDVVSRVAA